MRSLQIAILFSASALLVACGGGGVASNVGGALNTVVGSVTGGNTDDKETGETKDEKDTKGQAAIVGTAAGAFIGSRVANNSLVGGLIGGAVGGLAGYKVGEEIARRKKAYKSQEDMIEKESENVSNWVSELQKTNAQLRKDIAGYKKRIAEINKKMKEDSSRKAALKKEKASIEKKYKAAKQALEGVEKEIEVTQALYNDAKKSPEAKNASKLKAWEGKIASLKKEKVQLNQRTNDLQSVSSTISV